MPIETLIMVLRWTVFGAAALVCAGAFAAMAVQRRQISPFGAAARLVRNLTDPLLDPFERRLVRSGGNPRSAPWWLVGTALVGGILLVEAAQWVLLQGYRIVRAASGGAASLGYVLVDLAFGLVMVSLIVRVVGSWVGVSRYTWWMKPFVALTEWLLAPLRRVIPPLGPFDVSPIVAWFILLVVRGLLLS
jgi:YggT family protein